MSKATEVKDERKYLALEASFENWSDESVLLKFRFAKPTKPQIERTNKAIQKGRAESAMRNFLLGIIHPEEKEEFLTQAEEHVGLVTAFSDAIYERCGYGSVGK